MSQLLNDDREFLWHPFTQEKTNTNQLCIKSGNGPHLFDENGKQYTDLISSWWTNLHGHCNQAIANAIFKQSNILEHVIFAGATHFPAVDLCKKLKTKLPNELCKFFFSDNGSTAVEISLKMAYQFWRNSGQFDRKLFLNFNGGYHGDTFGAMSVSNTSGYHNHFNDLFFECKTVDWPYTWIGEEHKNIEEKEKIALNQLSSILCKYGKSVAAIILEPLIQGASGMRIVRGNFIEQVVKQVRKYDILVIFDEVMTGFFRTGKMFALDHISVIPDIICLSKGLTGGFMPLALTVVQKHVYDAFYSQEKEKTFLHGHSYTANPLGCAAAIESFNILMNSDTQNNIQKICKLNQEFAIKFANKTPIIMKVRSIGTILAFDVDHTIIDMLVLKCLEAGMLLRSLGCTIYILPPYCISENELIMCYEKISALIEQISI